MIENQSITFKRSRTGQEQRRMTETPITLKPQPLGSSAEVAEVLGIPEKTLREWRSRGIGPEYLKVGRYVRYRWSAVNAWLDTRRAGKGTA
jgi:predicted DNA-binding transcriptional regulator AlpA